MKRIVVKEIPGISPLSIPDDNSNNYNTYTTTKHEPWKTVYIVIENAHDCYGEMEHGRCETLEEAERLLELFCKTYGGRIEQTTYGELESITWY